MDEKRSILHTWGNYNTWEAKIWSAANNKPKKQQNDKKEHYRIMSRSKKRNKPTLVDSLWMFHSFSRNWNKKNGSIVPRFDNLTNQPLQQHHNLARGLNQRMRLSLKCLIVGHLILHSSCTHKFWECTCLIVSMSESTSKHRSRFSNLTQR